jgi:hypothetical protein
MKLLAAPVKSCLVLAVFSLLVPARGQQRPSLDVPSVNVADLLPLTVRGERGTNYAVEASADLTSWWKLFSGVATTGQVQFIYRRPPAGSARYFRARVDTPLPPLSVVVQPDTNAMTLGLVTPTAGGSLSLKDQRGVAYTLTFPSNAVVQPQVFFMNVVTNLGGLPFSAGLSGAVAVTPDSFPLLAPARLDITFPTNLNLDLGQMVGFAFGGNGQFLRLAPTLRDADFITLPVLDLGGLGCSIATLAEIRQQAQRAISDSNQNVSALQGLASAGGQAPQGGGDAGAGSLSFLAQCAPDKAARANAVRQSIVSAQGSLIQQLMGLSAEARANYGSAAVYTGNVVWAGDTPGVYEDFFQNNIQAYVGEAAGNCQLNVVLASMLDGLQDIADIWAPHYSFEHEFLNGGLPPSKLPRVDLSSDQQYLCPGFSACLEELRNCCGAHTVGGPAPFADLRVIETQAAQAGCNLSPAELNDVAQVCDPQWQGSVTIVESRQFSSEVQQQNIKRTVTENYETLTELTAVKLTGTTFVGGTASLAGTLQGWISGDYRYDELAVNSDCCGSGCTDETVDVSAIALQVTANMNLMWGLDPKLPCPFCTITVVPDTATGPNLARPSVSTETIVKKKGDACEDDPEPIRYGHGTQVFDFSIFPYFSPNQNGTANSVTGGYDTNYVTSDGIRFYQSVKWNFSRKSE